MLVWECKIPALQNSIWHPAILSATLKFTEEYPTRPPKVYLNPIKGEPVVHPNVFRDGHVCLSIVNQPESTHGYGRVGNWSPSISVKQILQALQVFLDGGDGFASGRRDIYDLFKHNREEYVRRVKLQVAKAEHIA